MVKLRLVAQESYNIHYELYCEAQAGKVILMTHCPYVYSAS